MKEGVNRQQKEDKIKVEHFYVVLIIEVLRVQKREGGIIYRWG